MIDMTFIRTVETALCGAFSGASAAGGDATRTCPCEPDCRRICKDVAQRLFFELDGLALLDLGMSKLEAEQQDARGRPPIPPIPPSAEGP